MIDRAKYKELFISFRPMIERKVWEMNKVWNGCIEVNELRSQAYLIFCKSISTFDENRASFSTYLYHQLRALNDFCISQMNWNMKTDVKHAELFFEAEKYSTSNGWNTLDGHSYGGQHSPVSKIPKELWHLDTFIKTIERMEGIAMLSKDAQEIISFITSRDWEILGKAIIRPSYHSVGKVFQEDRKWKPSRFREAWGEIKEWWIKEAV